MVVVVMMMEMMVWWRSGYNEDDDNDELISIHQIKTTAIDGKAGDSELSVV